MKSLVKEGVQKKGQKLFCVLSKEKKTFLSKRRMGLFAAVFEGHYEKAWRWSSQFSFFLQLVHLLFYFWTFWGDVSSPLSQPLPVPHLLFAPDSPKGMYSRAGKKAGWHVERKWEIETHKVNDQCKKETIYSQGKQMDHASDLPHKNCNSIHIHKQTGIPTQSEQKTGTVFYVTFVSSWFVSFVLSGMWF